jgi:hypothetical protein
MVQFVCRQCGHKQRSRQLKGETIMAKKINAAELALDQIALQFSTLVCEAGALSEMLGDLVREAAKHVKTSDDIDQFTDACKRHCASAGLTEGSFKVYLSNVRGVLKAMLEGYEPADGAGLRAMYDARPGSGTTKRGARTGGGKDDKKPSEPVTATRADLIRHLFGFHSAELEAACDYAKDHSAMFMSWASASAKAEQAQMVTKLKKAA